ncbi:hypothetical protein OF829_00235 [Sphingomonas sp. LB-2]|uniref:hypothetical protein n=1 Tax=Sphingomonas caeni TaxID=2984949 RepID=UPI00222F19AA|nr:hypothetical protein [Sphingomonas caeni]MCW3845649.1 hypothetical protein [Sphingomonas caeni]
MGKVNLMRIAISVAALALASPVIAQAVAMTPAQAIAAAAASPSGEVKGTIEFVVASTGEGGFNVYLNSEADYRNPANFSAELHSEAINAMKAKFGGHPVDTMKGKRIRVTGVVRRVAIPKRDGGNYYQTRMDIDLPSQIEILG